MAPVDVASRTVTDNHTGFLDRFGIWLWAFGYFACYVPYSALTKALSGGLLGDEAISGFSLLPVSVAASTVGMLVFITAVGWWKYATHRTIFGRSVPTPTVATAVSGACTAVIIATTTLAYTFEGISIVFAMLLMRGGVLVIAPIIDALSHREVRWFSWVALALSLSALVVAFADKGGYALSFIAGIDIAAYLLGYFLRLRLMSARAKSPDPSANFRYFVEEQMVATPLVLTALLITAAISDVGIAGQIRHGITHLPWTAALLPVVLLGILSQGTGVFGGLILLDKRENSFCVPVNRSSSILAGVLASFVLMMWLDLPMPGHAQLLGAGLIIVAVLFLSLPTLLAPRSKQP
ncbi:MAG: hypothetical protein KC502_20620 [Myxococcales bacterium]|nr:hypothetical protein [Myxococcales bacterium]